ncbi:hypothetical protein [Ectopseudomonas oleovorans]
MLKHHPELTTGKPIDRNSSTKALSQRAISDATAGIRAANSVQLQHGVRGTEQLALT